MSTAWSRVSWRTSSGVDLSVTGQIEPEAAHRVDRDAPIGGAAGIVRIIHVPALAADDLS